MPKSQLEVPAHEVDYLRSRRYPAIALSKVIGIEALRENTVATVRPLVRLAVAKHEGICAAPNPVVLA